MADTLLQKGETCKSGWGWRRRKYSWIEAAGGEQYNKPLMAVFAHGAAAPFAYDSAVRLKP